MDKSRLKEQVEIIRQAFGYINRYKNEIFVIKIDDTLVSSPFFPILVKDLVLLHKMGIRIVLVPGARNRINDILQTYHKECRSVNGIRISEPDAIPFIKMAAFDVSNNLMTSLAEHDTNAVIGNWVRAKSIGVRNGIDYQSSGMVERLQTEILKNVIEDGLIPIFPNIGWNAKGKPYNLSSNELAYTIGVELKAAKLFFLTNRSGISTNGFKIPEGIYISSDKIITQLSIAQAAHFLELNSGMLPNEQLELVSLALRACSKGIRRVHIIDGSSEGLILKEIFSNRGLGTMIYSNQHENIRLMKIPDIADVLRLMQPAIEQQILVNRTASDLEKKVSDYVVYEVDGTIHACGALHEYPDGQSEIAAIVVDEMYTNLGIGKKVISYLMDKAAKQHHKAVFVLTTQTSDWFIQLGFTPAKITDLPLSKQQDFNRKRNSRILRYQLSENKTSFHSE
ncbi:MAG TPA: amino-acid N-acetyltransferase [Chitinispirillaceae bacterium]|nr:amino-acid N-acetyltransferase [Chitinispirillaceae bacterium]